MKRADMLIDVMNKIVGYDIKVRSRARCFSFPRFIVIWQMIQEEYTTLEIGRQMGMHHATICHARDVVQDMLSMPKAYPQEMKWYEQFKKNIR